MTLELNERLTPEIVDAYLQRLLWEKDVVNSEGLALEIFRLKVCSTPFQNLTWPRCKPYCLTLRGKMQGIVRYSQPESASSSVVIIQAVYDTYDVMPIKPEASDSGNREKESLEADARFVFIGESIA